MDTCVGVQMLYWLNNQNVTEQTTKEVHLFLTHLCSVQVTTGLIPTLAAPLMP